MSDIKINWDSTLNEGDFNFLTATNDLEGDDSLQTAVVISLFSDRRANDDDQLPDFNSTDRRGWWGDLSSPISEGDQIGSRLWLLERAKATESVLSNAQKYAEEALQWMVDDGVAVKIDVEVERQGIVGNDLLALQVKIYRIDGNEEAFNFDLQWKAQANN